METYLNGMVYNTVLMVPVNQYPEVGYWILRGILNFESWYPSWIQRKNINFRSWLPTLLFHSDKGRALTLNGLTKCKITRGSYWQHCSRKLAKQCPSNRNTPLYTS